MKLLHGFGIVASSAGISFANAGYAAGPGTVDKFLFADDSRVTLAAGLSPERGGTAQFGSLTAGYVVGGGGPTTVVNKFAFSNDTRSNVAAGFPSQRTQLAGFASPTAGYAAGGTPPGGLPAIVSTVDKYTFSDDSRSEIAPTLSTFLAYMVGFASSTAGYVTGGYSRTPGGNKVSTVNKFAFSNDARSTLATGLSAVSNNNACMAGPAAGYCALGATEFVVSTIDKFAFSNDARSTLGTGLSSTRRNAMGFASATAGYIAGGVTPTGSVATVDRFLFSNDSRTTLGTGLSSARSTAQGFDNTKAFL